MVSDRAVVALCTLASALSTAACADGTLPADEVDDPPLPDPLPLDVVVVDELLSAELSWSSAAVRFCSAWSRASWAVLEFSVASNCPLLTCWPTLTYTFESVPLVWKFTFMSVPGSTFPEPDTVDCTTPLAAVRICVDVRAELVGGPISATASATRVRPTTART